MRLKQESRVLKQKALDSLIFTIEAFNSPHDGGRATRCCCIFSTPSRCCSGCSVQTKDKRVFDSETGRSIGFERCLGWPGTTSSSSVTDAGTLRAIDAMRDDEQHSYNVVPEQLLYMHAQPGDLVR